MGRFVIRRVQDRGLVEAVDWQREWNSIMAEWGRRVGWNAGGGCCNLVVVCKSTGLVRFDASSSFADPPSTSKFPFLHIPLLWGWEQKNQKNRIFPRDFLPSTLWLSASFNVCASIDIHEIREKFFPWAAEIKRSSHDDLKLSSTVLNKNIYRFKDIGNLLQESFLYFLILQKFTFRRIDSLFGLF